MGEVVLRVAGRLARFARDLRLHLGIGDHDVVVDLPLPQAREHDLRADVLAEARVADAVALQRGAEGRGR
ncbi:hypothetical protein D3C83_167590 [compost metagenome]